MENRNYQKILDNKIKELNRDGEVPSLLLHSCCAPCSSYVLEYLSDYFEIHLFYYNPNIYPPEEYAYREAEQQRLIDSMSNKHPVTFIQGEFNTSEFYGAIKGLENEPEGGARCLKCYELRLRETAKMAKKIGAEYFTTTLTISPLKKAAMINDLGLKIGAEEGVSYLQSDFKKKNGYKRSVELSEAYDLYRQDYCGCVYSKMK
ncbi:epoxyqueuosine reductase QueH [Parasporobacterium paucivorans]